MRGIAGFRGREGRRGGTCIFFFSGTDLRVVVLEGGRGEELVGFAGADARADLGVLFTEGFLARAGFVVLLGDACFFGVCGLSCAGFTELEALQGDAFSMIGSGTGSFLGISVTEASAVLVVGEELGAEVTVSWTISQM